MMNTFEKKRLDPVSNISIKKANPVSYKKNVEVGTVSPKNQLNDLNSKEWIAFTKSWFIENPTPRKKEVVLHPAKYPESLAKRFLKFFTKARNGSMVFDPFLGTGSTLVAVEQLNNESDGNRRAIGIELNPDYVEIAKTRNQQRIICADSIHYPVDKLPEIDFIMTSPPYWNVLHKKTGHIHKQRKAQGMDLVYSDNESDLGNIKDYEEFITILSRYFARLSTRLKNKKFCVVVLSSTNCKGQFYPLPYDFARAVQKNHL